MRQALHSSNPKPLVCIISLGIGPKEFPGYIRSELKIKLTLVLGGLGGIAGVVGSNQLDGHQP